MSAGGRKEIMLMSNVGGANGVSGAILSFAQSGFQMRQPDRIPSGGPWIYQPNNYGQVSQMPRDGTDPPAIHSGAYSIDLDAVSHDDPNHDWKLYIYDWYQGAHGHLEGSWQLNFYFR